MLSKKIIKKDMFNIAQRIKQIDKNYFILFNYKTKKWEVHNSMQIGSTYCLTCPYESLDCRLLDYVYYTSTQHNANIIKEIEDNNKKIEEEIYASEKDYIRSNLLDIYKYASNNSKDIEIDKILKNKWL